MGLADHVGVMNQHTVVMSKVVVVGLGHSLTRVESGIIIFVLVR